MGDHTMRIVKKYTKSSPIRSLLKALTWRVVASGTTITVAYLLTGDAVVAGAIGGAEALCKIAMYFLHERMWQSIYWGMKEE